MLKLQNIISSSRLAGISKNAATEISKNAAIRKMGGFLRNVSPKLQGSRCHLIEVAASKTTELKQREEDI